MTPLVAAIENALMCRNMNLPARARYWDYRIMQLRGIAVPEYHAGNQTAAHRARMHIGEKTRQQILDALVGPMTTTQIGNAVGINRKTAYMALLVLEEEDRVRRGGKASLIEWERVQ